ncbi:MAG: hypothetical protein ACI9LM_002516, partial [Alteromonadaceae bacterium]
MVYIRYKLGDTKCTKYVIILMQSKYPMTALLSITIPAIVQSSA